MAQDRLQLRNPGVSGQVLLAALVVPGVAAIAQRFGPDVVERLHAMLDRIGELWGAVSVSAVAMIPPVSGEMRSRASRPDIDQPPVPR